jgi:hypothetical protein
VLAVETDRAAAFALVESELVVIVLDEVRRRLVQTALADNAAVQGDVGLIPLHPQHAISRAYPAPRS